MKTEAEINAEKHAKPRVDIVPPALVLAAGKALGFGASKHGVPEGNNGFGTWRTAGTEQAEPLTHYACLLRHLLLWRGGEAKDPDSGLSHLDHAAAQLGILLDLLERPPQPSSGQPLQEKLSGVDPWALPEGWYWWEDECGWNASTDGAYVDFFGDCINASVDAPESVVELVKKRNGAAT